jgi:hypothetical protein
MAGEGDKYRYETREYPVCSWRECNIYNSATSHMAGEGNKYRYETREYPACSWREYYIYISMTSHMAGEDDKYRHETRVYPECSWREYHIYNPATNSHQVINDPASVDCTYSTGNHYGPSIYGGVGDIS